MASIDPDVPMFRVRTTAQLAASSVAQPRLLTLLIGLFASAALLVAAIGLYGVLAQSVAVRFKEIGIRRAVGATTRDIAGLVAGESARLVGTGVAIGLVASLALHNVVSTFVFEATSVDAATYLGAVVAFVAVSAIRRVRALCASARRGSGSDLESGMRPGSPAGDGTALSSRLGLRRAVRLRPWSTVTCNSAPGRSPISIATRPPKTRPCSCWCMRSHSARRCGSRSFVPGFTAGGFSLPICVALAAPPIPWARTRRRRWTTTPTTSLA